MSRSNGPVTRAGSHQQDWPPPAEPDLPGPSHQPHRWPPIFRQPAPARHPQPAAHPDHAQPDGPAPSYHYPQGHYPQEHHPQGHYPQEDYGHDQYSADAGDGHQPFATPARHPPFFSDQPAPQRQQPERYGSAFEDLLASQHQEQQASGHYDDQGLAQLQPPGQARRSHASLRDQLQATHPARDPEPLDHDRRGYDLGSYMPSAADAEPPGYGNAHPAGRDSHLDPHWQDPGYGYGSEHGAHPGGAADYYAQLGGEALPVEQDQEFDPEADEADDYEYEETGGRRRGLLIAVALVGAIAVGGGLAYGYKTIVGPTPKGTPPVIKADARPAKSQPEDPGGRQFAHSDSKLMGRLDVDGASSASSNSGSARASTLDDADASGVRRVPTIIVGRDGSIAPPAEPKLPPGTNGGTVSVPGMTIVNGFGGRPTMQPQRSAEPEQSAEVPPAAPRIIARATPEPQSPAPVARVAPRVPPLPVRSADVLPPSSRPAATQPRVTQPAPRQAAVSPPPTSDAVGYVAVLASQKSRIDALKTFADLQQQYMDVLQNKIPDVLEADLSARGLGTMYRVVVGPPGSREAASTLCGQLKSAGFQGCWITAY